jgi:hypothetical protein
MAAFVIRLASLLFLQVQMDPRKLLFIIPLFMACVASAQEVFTINGALYRANTSDRVAQAVITDLKSNVVMMSDELGGFHIQVSKGDTLLISKVGFTPQKSVVTGTGDVLIYLTAAKQLAEVTIKDKSEKQEMADVVNEYRSKGLYFDGKPTAWEFLNSPVTAVYELLGRDARNERHFIQYTKDESQAIEVDRRYTRKLVKQVTGLSDDNVTKFMQQYRPSYEDIRGWNDYDLISHIKKYLVYFNKHKDDVSTPLAP